MTYSVINTLLKYVVSSEEALYEDEDVRKHKLGYFLTEETFFRKIRDDADIPQGSRYPLTFLLEAADDIAYITSDLEDSIKNGKINVPMFIRYFESELDKIPDEGSEFHEIQKMSSAEILNNLKRRTADVINENSLFSIFNEWIKYIRNWLLYSTAHAFLKTMKA